MKPERLKARKRNIGSGLIALPHQQGEGESKGRENDQPRLEPKGRGFADRSLLEEGGFQAADSREKMGKFRVC